MCIYIYVYIYMYIYVYIYIYTCITIYFTYSIYACTITSRVLGSAAYNVSMLYNARIYEI